MQNRPWKKIVIDHGDKTVNAFRGNTAGFPGGQFKNLVRSVKLWEPKFSDSLLSEVKMLNTRTYVEQASTHARYGFLKKLNSSTKSWEHA
ncbi:MAG: hypothetical protein Ct9H300mP28_07500 [Pseudomonadota bacterium]|nr:MAG: hypothetical protein Ct9H300mP28_07500 [Pseudomonadota bacterium]